MDGDPIVSNASSPLFLRRIYHYVKAEFAFPDAKIVFLFENSVLQASWRAAGAADFASLMSMHIIVGVKRKKNGWDAVVSARSRQREI